jgi:hypothetical protein
MFADLTGFTSLVEPRSRSADLLGEDSGLEAVHRA